MKVFLLLFVVVLSSCTSNRDLEQTLPKEKQFSIETKICQGDDILSNPQVTVLEGKKAVIRIVQEKFLPSQWRSLTHPAEMEAMEFGIRLETVAVKIPSNDEKAIIHLQGMVVLSEEPIEEESNFNGDKELLEQALSFSEDTCLYSFYIKDGSTKELKFKAGDKEYTVSFTVHELDLSDLPRPSKDSTLPDFKNL